ncbi:unnamed protein product [Nyctereutes procyonoides]|uniref:(raccoon dog) hypothetical protein n=1 Tax=Nyctereutes procyonoides TaxID=34880 RepID=A0A811YXE8_NYCPR|nr:unnamed protein product [Nyctereutes procyonoides]
MLHTSHLRQMLDTIKLTEIVRKLELEVEPEDDTELLESHDKTRKNEDLIITAEQRKRISGMESTAGEDAVKSVEMTTVVLEYYRNLVDKAVVDYLRMIPALKEVLL